MTWAVWNPNLQLGDSWHTSNWFDILKGYKGISTPMLECHETRSSQILSRDSNPEVCSLYIEPKYFNFTELVDESFISIFEPDCKKMNPTDGALTSSQKNPETSSSKEGQMISPVGGMKIMGEELLSCSWALTTSLLADVLTFLQIGTYLTAKFCLLLLYKKQTEFASVSMRRRSSREV